MPSYEFAASPPDTRLERTPFTVIVSSPHLAFSAIRRFDLWCERQGSALYHKGRPVATGNRPKFDELQQQAMYKMYTLLD